MSVKKIFFLPCIVLASLSCSRETPGLYSDSTSFNAEAIENTHLVDGKTIQLNPVVHTYSFEVLDSLLICTGPSVDNSCKMHIYNLNTQNRIVSFADEGRGPDEFVKVDGFSISRVRREVYIIDNNQQLLLSYSIDSLLADPETAPLREMSFRGSEFAPEFVIDSNSFLCTDAVPFKSPNVITKIEYPSLGVSSVAGYPPLDDFDSVKLARHYQGVFGRNISYNDEVKRIAVSYVTTDLIEIYDENLTRIARINGPDHFLPIYEVKGTPKNYAQYLYQGKSYKDLGVMGITTNPVKGVGRYAYLSMSTNSEGIYALYSGVLVSEDNTIPPMVRTIYFFDYEGNARHRYTVEIGDLYVIRVDADNKRLFTIHNGDLMVYSLNN